MEDAASPDIGNSMMAHPKVDAPAARINVRRDMAEFIGKKLFGMRAKSRRTAKTRLSPSEE